MYYHTYITMSWMKRTNQVAIRRIKVINKSLENRAKSILQKYFVWEHMGVLSRQKQYKYVVFLLSLHSFFRPWNRDKTEGMKRMLPKHLLVLLHRIHIRILQVYGCQPTRKICLCLHDFTKCPLLLSARAPDSCQTLKQAKKLFWQRNRARAHTLAHIYFLQLVTNFFPTLLKNSTVALVIYRPIYKPTIVVVSMNTHRKF